MTLNIGIRLVFAQMIVCGPLDCIAAPLMLNNAGAVRVTRMLMCFEHTLRGAVYS